MDREQSSASSQPSQEQLKALSMIIGELPNVQDSYDKLDPSVQQVAEFFQSLSPEEREVLAKTSQTMKKAGMTIPLETGGTVCIL